jgi:hypothetical protein
MTLPLSYRFARALISLVVLAGVAAAGYAAWRGGLTDALLGTGRSIADAVVALWRSA